MFGARRYLRAMTEAVTAARPPDLPPFDEIVENFSFLDDWEDRYRYLIELGRAMGEFPESDRTPANKVQGCASQVWVTTRTSPGDGKPVLLLRGDSDALIVRGLVALLVSLLSGRAPADVSAMDVQGALRGLGLDQHLTPQRSNGLASMIKRVQAEAAALGRA